MFYHPMILFYRLVVVFPMGLPWFTLNTEPIFFPVLQVPIITAALQAGAKAQDKTDRDWAERNHSNPAGN